MRVLILFGAIVFLVSSPAFLRAQSAHDPRPKIDKVRPAAPAQGQTFDIQGEHFGNTQGKWVVHLSHAKTYELEVFEWTNSRIRVRVPDEILPSAELPSGRQSYSVTITVPGRLLQSNRVPVTVRERPRNQPPPPQPSDALWVDRADSTTVGLLIWGVGFGMVGGGASPPQGCKVVVSGYGREFEPAITLWTDNGIKARLSDLPSLEKGVYQVWVVTGTGPGTKSNSVPLAVRPDKAGFMHIDAVRQRAEKFYPAVQRGTTVDIIGRNFEVPGHPGQWKRAVTLVSIKHGRATRHTLEIAVRDGIKQWFNDYILAEIPGNIEPGDYLLQIADADIRVENRLDLRPSNAVVVKVMPGGERLRIFSVSTLPLLPGADLTISGQQFGENKGQHVVVLKQNNDVYDLSVRNWSPTEIHVRTPATLPSGEYWLVIYNDLTRKDLADWYRVTVRRTEDIAGKKTDSKKTDGQKKGVAPAPMLLSVEPKSAAPGQVLTLRGDHLGMRQGERMLAINHDGHSNRMQVEAWSDQQIRARVPAGLDPGKYRLLIYANASMRTSSNSLTVTIKRPRARRAASLDLPVLLALGMDGLTAPAELDSDLAMEGGELAVAQRKPIKKRKPAERPLKERKAADADLAAVSIKEDHYDAWMNDPEGNRIHLSHYEITGEVRNVSKVQYLGDCNITLSRSTVRSDLIGAEPRVLKTTTLRKLDAGDSYFIRAQALEDDIYDPQAIYNLEISHRDANPENNKITKVFKRHIRAPLPGRKVNSPKLEPVRAADSKTPDLAAVSIRHTRRVIGEYWDADGKVGRIIQNSIRGEVKNVSKVKYDGRCEIRLSEGALQDDGSIAASPRLLKKTVLFGLAPGESHKVQADVEANYWDPKIYILEVSYKDDNQKNNKITQVFKKP